MTDIRQQVRTAFPKIEDSTIADLASRSSFVEAPKGAEIFQVGDQCEQFYFVLDGVIRVQLVADNGREIVLYRVRAGEICVLTTANLLGGVPYNAEALTESEIKVLSVPKQHFFNLMNKSESFRATVFSLFSSRLTDIILLLERIAFRGIDARLAEYLISRGVSGVVVATHAEIASDLGTAREVIGRQLKAFAADELVGSEPGNILIRDRKRLKKIAIRE